jgi:hypothetical protein
MKQNETNLKPGMSGSEPVPASGCQGQGDTRPAADWGEHVTDDEHPAGDLAEIEAAAATIEVQGARRPEHLKRLTGR